MLYYMTMLFCSFHANWVVCLAPFTQTGSAFTPLSAQKQCSTHKQPQIPRVNADTHNTRKAISAKRETLSIFAAFSRKHIKRCALMYSSFPCVYAEQKPKLQPSCTPSTNLQISTPGCGTRRGGRPTIKVTQRSHVAYIYCILGEQPFEGPLPSATLGNAHPTQTTPWELMSES